MTLTMEEAIDRACPKFCVGCGADLPRPGEECAACGELPRLLRQEAAEQLAAPGVLAGRQAEALREEGQRLLGEWSRRLQEADQILHIDRLAQAAGRAEDELTAGIARRDQAEAALKAPRSAEKRAARERDDAAAARREFDLALRRAERLKQGTKAIVLARQALTLADEELAAKETALAYAQGTVRQAQAAFAQADAEVQRLTGVRDRAVRSVANPGTVALSAESLEALCGPVIAIAREAFAVRMGRPNHQYVLEDVYDDRVACAISMAKALGIFTGVSAADEAAGTRAGREQALAEQAARPGLRKGNSVDDMAIVAPGFRRIPGGVLPGASRAVPDPARSGPALAINQGNPHRPGDTVYRHPGRTPDPGPR